MSATHKSLSRPDRANLPLWLTLVALVVVSDQFVKWLIVGNYQLGDATYITSFFNIVRVHNTGAAFSFLASHSGWQRWFFTGIALVASLFILWLMLHHGRQKLFCFALACIMGGAIGNVIDRILHGYVVDYLDFYWGRWHYPAFNLADGTISVGVGLLILDELLKIRANRKNTGA